MAGTRKIAAIQVADVVGSNPARGRTLSRLLRLRSDPIDTPIDSHRLRIVKRTTDPGLIEFFVVDREHNAVVLPRGSPRSMVGLQ
jgi:class 3 adenylate cyclase